MINCYKFTITGLQVLEINFLKIEKSSGPRKETFLKNPMIIFLRILEKNS